MFSFSEDMLPRHFPRIHLPKSAKQLDQTLEVIPQPTLPSVSLICPSNEKKQVRFVTDNPEDHSCSKGRRITTEHKQPTHVRSNLELSYFESPQKGQPRQSYRTSENKINQPAPASKFLTRSPFEINFRQYDRALRTELIKENCFSRPVDNNKCRKNAHQEATNVGFSFHGRIGEQKLQSSDEILLNILEDQQKHISIQKNQILLLEEQSLEQQKEIYILKHRIQELQNDADEDRINANESTNFSGMPRLIDVLDEKNAAHFANEKMISGESLHAGDADAIRNSSAIFNYKINKLLSVNQHSDINITAQALIYEASRNSSYVNAQVATDRSVMLNMLGLKYNCSEGSFGTGHQNLDYNQSSFKRNDQISQNVSCDMYDYLVRHGLMKR